MVTASQLATLGSGQMCVGVRLPHPPRDYSEPSFFGRDALLRANPHKDAKQWPTEPTLSCLEGRSFIGYSPYEANYFHQLVQGYLDRDGIKPDTVQYVAQIHTMLALVDAGVGVALTPETASRLRFEGVLLRRVKTNPARPVEMVFSHRKANDN